MWNCYSWSLITMKFNLVFVSVHDHGWMEDSPPGLTSKHQMQVNWLHFFKKKWHWDIKDVSLYRENSKVMLAHELSFQMMDSKVLGFLEFSDFSLLELPNYVTHNMLLHYCEIRMENYFWNWIRSLFTWVNCCNVWIRHCGGLCENVQIRESLTKK